MTQFKLLIQFQNMIQFKIQFLNLDSIQIINIFLIQI